jgi:hypothetical protein
VVFCGNERKPQRERHNATYSFFFRGIDRELNTTEELAALIPMKGAAIGVDLYEEFKKVLQGLAIPKHKMAVLVRMESPVWAAGTVACLRLQSTT